MRVDGEILGLEDIKPLKKSFRHDIEAVVDRIVIKKSSRSRITDSVETALKLSDGLMVALLDDVEKKKQSEERFSEKFACPDHGSVLEEMSPRIFSFNSPFGSCPTCLGLGTMMEPAPELIIQEDNLSLEEGALAAWKRCGSGLGSFYPQSVKRLARYFDISIKTPWREIPKKTRNEMLSGDKNQGTRNTGYEGIIPNLKRRFLTTDSENQKARIHEFMTSLPCQDCHGQRLQPGALAVKINDLNIFQITEMTVERAFDYFMDLKLKKEKKQIAEPIN